MVDVFTPADVTRLVGRVTADTVGLLHAKRSQVLILVPSGVDDLSLDKGIVVFEQRNH